MKDKRLPLAVKTKNFYLYYDVKVIITIYGLLFFCNFLINIDHGTLPAATLDLKLDLGIDNVALGFLGSLVFLGLTFGKF
jgi:hypothetical protein